MRVISRFESSPAIKDEVVFVQRPRLIHLWRRLVHGSTYGLCTAQDNLNVLHLFVFPLFSLLTLLVFEIHLLHIKALLVFDSCEIDRSAVIL
jgi:hypothetical protein